MLKYILLLFLISYSSCTYFYLTEGTPRCFIEEVPVGTFVSVRYKLASPPENLQVQMVIKNPFGEVLLTKDTDGMSMTTAKFNAVVAGDHLICFQTASSSWTGGNYGKKIIQRIDFGEHAIDYTDVAKREHLSAIELEIRKCVDKLKAIRSEHSYQIGREELFRNTSESTNTRVMMWSFIQTIVLTVLAVYQIQHLKSFFKSKKLV